MRTCTRHYDSRSPVCPYPSRVLDAGEHFRGGLCRAHWNGGGLDGVTPRVLPTSVPEKAPKWSGPPSRVTRWAAVGAYSCKLGPIGRRFVSKVIGGAHRTIAKWALA